MFKLQRNDNFRDDELYKEVYGDESTFKQMFPTTYEASSSNGVDYDPPAEVDLALAVGRIGRKSATALFAANYIGQDMEKGGYVSLFIRALNPQTQDVVSACVNNNFTGNHIQNSVKIPVDTFDGYEIFVCVMQEDNKGHHVYDRTFMGSEFEINFSPRFNVSHPAKQDGRTGDYIEIGIGYHTSELPREDFDYLFGKTWITALKIKSEGKLTLDSPVLIPSSAGAVQYAVLREGEIEIPYNGAKPTVTNDAASITWRFNEDWGVGNMQKYRTRPGRVTDLYLSVVCPSVNGRTLAYMVTSNERYVSKTSEIILPIRLWIS